MADRKMVEEKLKILKDDKILRNLIKAMVISYLDFRRLKLKDGDIYNELSYDYARMNIGALLEQEGVGRDLYGLLEENYGILNSCLDEVFEEEKKEVNQRLSDDSCDEFEDHFAYYLASVLSGVLSDFCDTFQVERFLVLIKENKNDPEVRESFLDNFLKTLQDELTNKIKEKRAVGRHIYPYTTV